MLADISPEQTQKIQSLLNNYRARLGIPGAAVSIALPGRNEPLHFVSGTTTQGGSRPITKDTKFQAGSISKSFTSMIILQLEAQGDLELDDSITQYLPQYPRWQNVTIRELLNHTSGIFEYTKTGRFKQIRTCNPSQTMTPAQLVQMACAHSSYFPPSKGWKYSNTNYVLLGMIIEAITHKPYGEVLDSYIHNNPKLNLTSTYYRPRMYSAEEIAEMAHGYSSSGVDVITSNMSWAYSAGAIVTTPTDLLTWWQSLFQNRILSTHQLNQMMSLVYEHTSRNHYCLAGRPAPQLQYYQVDKRYGLGIVQSASGSADIGTIWWHNGSTQGFKAIVMWLPKSNIYLSFMINRDPGYLVEPSLPVIRNILRVLVTGSCPNTATSYHYVRHHKHKIVHKKRCHLKHKIRHHKSSRETKIEESAF